ncbi:MAG: helix-turn-helix transcriptional regulator [Clostridia bacterium]|nr:helix-turn-helix transcriptional regulator [Clostridia bacterium]
MSEEEHFQRFAVKHDLSQREREIMRLLLQKETTPMIADRLFVSESTVKFHVHNILQKTGCSSRKELYEHFEQDRIGS